ncbi:MAG TPA: ATP-binding protein [Bacteroidales bacterium]|jgi:predicted AAA+ superfamily ATPase|nr:ATP-binding protein [Bacteroidales bacterium]
MKETLLQIAYSQKERLSAKPGLVEREMMAAARKTLHTDNRILVITGMRRTGKSTLLQQLMGEVENYCYFNFEDERLMDLRVEHFGDLEEALIEVYGPSAYWFFDEIQNISNFETAVRRMQDDGKKIILTGSNASLLSMEFGTKLTGRYKQIELFPFSFAEYLNFMKVEFSNKHFYLPESKVMLRNHFSQWMEKGGLPEYLLYNDLEYVKTLFDNILYRDIIVHYGIRRHREFRELVQLLVSNLTLPVTYNSLMKAVGFSNADTIKEHLAYLGNAYAFYELFRYNDSLRKQMANPRKVYVNDLAFHTLIGFNNSQNLGRRLENVIYMSLKRKYTDLYSFKGNHECDFVVKDRQLGNFAIQACHAVNAENEPREAGGLVEAIQSLNLTYGLIITFDQEFDLQYGGYSITVVPAWKWMLTEQ